jgi:hypothetical protein
MSSLHHGAPVPQAPRILVGFGDDQQKIDHAEFDRRTSVAAGTHLEQIYAAVRSGRLTFTLIPQGARYRGLPDSVTDRPLLFILGDDLDMSKGPRCFDVKTLKRVLGGAGGVIVHAAKAEPAHYAIAVDAAQRYSRAVVIECQPCTQSAWRAAVAKYAPGAGVLVITPMTYASVFDCGDVA